jgi:hypothetical protein
MRSLLTFFIFISHFLYSQEYIYVPDQYSSIQLAIMVWSAIGIEPPSGHFPDALSSMVPL